MTLPASFYPWPFAPVGLDLAWYAMVVAPTLDPEPERPARDTLPPHAQALHDLGACARSLLWARDQPDGETAWRTCKQPRWMFWLLGRLVQRGQANHAAVVGLGIEACRRTLPRAAQWHASHAYLLDALQAWTLTGSAPLDAILHHAERCARQSDNAAGLETRTYVHDLRAKKPAPEHDTRLFFANASATAVYNLARAAACPAELHDALDVMADWVIVATAAENTGAARDRAASELADLIRQRVPRCPLG